LPTGNGLVDAFGGSLVDRAIADALCRHRQLTLAEMLSQNRLGVAWTLFAPDLAGEEAGDWLQSLRPLSSTAVRHTVGFSDPVWSRDVESRPDEFPVAIEEIVVVDGVSCFKTKLCGDIGADLSRLAAVAALLDTQTSGCRVTLDGNEQYSSRGQLLEFLRRASRTPALERLWAATAFVEQPLARAVAFEEHVGDCSAIKPLLIDESDDHLGAALLAGDTGYGGVSVKSCKGLYKSLVNAARGQIWRRTRPWIVSAEDLTVQAGIALSQNLALWSALGIDQAERNGHYYGKGPDALPETEREALLRLHPDLFACNAQHHSRLRVTAGRLSLASVNAARGFGTSLIPDVASMRPTFLTALGAPSTGSATTSGARRP
jgi:hypothetical protein